jgi:hypothetical protein
MQNNKITTAPFPKRVFITQHLAGSSGLLQGHTTYHLQNIAKPRCPISSRLAPTHEGGFVAREVATADLGALRLDQSLECELSQLTDEETSAKSTASAPRPDDAPGYGAPAAVRCSGLPLQPGEPLPRRLLLSNSARHRPPNLSARASHSAGRRRRKRNARNRLSPEWSPPSRRSTKGGPGESVAALRATGRRDRRRLRGRTMYATTPAKSLKRPTTKSST